MEAPATSRLWALVLAGGDGTGLQALTRLIAGAPIPKQYCRIVGDRSLLETTLARIAPLVPPERTLAIVNRGHLPPARPQLATIPASNVLVQPRNLDTGPGLVVSLLALARRDAAATVAVFPSDHDIRDEVAFRRHVARMALLVTAHPDRIAASGRASRAARDGLRLHFGGTSTGRTRRGVPRRRLPREARSGPGRPDHRARGALELVRDGRPGGAHARAGARGPSGRCRGPGRDTGRPACVPAPPATSRVSSPRRTCANARAATTAIPEDAASVPARVATISTA
jgi:hypothetical protein